MGLFNALAVANPFTAIGTAAAGAGNVWGTVYANRANQREADANRAFQAEMSNTAYQRAMQDMEASGLNPMLSLTHQASTPSGAMAEHQAPQFGEIVSSALQGMKVIQELESSQAGISKTKAETALTEAAIPGAAAQSRNHIASASIADRIAQLTLNEREVQDKYVGRRELARAESMTNEAILGAGDVDIQKWGEHKFAKEGHLFQDLAIGLKHRMTDALIRELDLPGARAEAKAYTGVIGEKRPYIRDAAGVASAFGSAAGAHRALTYRPRGRYD